MFKLKSLTTPSAMLTVLTLVAAPSFAQERNHGRERAGGRESSGRSTEQAQPRRDAAPAPAPAQTPAPAPRAETRRQETPRAESRPERQNPRVENRRNDERRDNVVGRAVPRRDYAPRYESRDDSRYAPRFNYAPRYYAPRAYAPRSYYRPYVFRPRYSIGFGIFSGYAVPYSYSYGYPIEVYGYGAPRERVMITPGSNYYGGVALEITPGDADVYVDGEYAGRVEDFDGTTQPLTLTAGTHQLEVRAGGYEPMLVDVGIQAGQVVPFRGDLRRD